VVTVEVKGALKKQIEKEMDKAVEAALNIDLLLQAEVVK
jgi:hypothetical protein